MRSDLPPDLSELSAESWLAGAAGHENTTPQPSAPDWRAWILPAFLLLATVLSTTFAGLFYVLGDVGFLRMVFLLVAHPTLLLKGVPFSFTLVTILFAHEMGHYLACRHYGIRCTPPFFIPFPVTYAGTLGAFIRIKSNFQHKRALFDVGIAGPLAGFAFVIPALVIGIASSTLVPKGSAQGDMYFGEPLLFRWVGAVVLGYVPETQDMIGHPIAMAAWFGLLVTSLNLFPIWQLDGGHIAYALLGRERQKRLSLAAAFGLMLIGFAGWPIPSYLLFAALLLGIGMRYRFYHPPTLSDHEVLDPGRIIFGIVALLILVLSFTPVPISIQ